MNFISIEKKEYLEITLNRPELHNAFNSEMIKELTDIFKNLKDERLVVLTGSGKSFSAGADLNWMKSMISFSEEENYRDSMALANMFEIINQCPVPVIGKVNGHALGGGVGLVSVCDYIIASTDAKFGFTEVRLGIIPAVISPFVIAKIGESAARAWFLSGERFSAQQAKQMQLVHEVVASSCLDTRIEEIAESFLKAGPQAAQHAKKLIFAVQKSQSPKELTCKEIAKLRISSEGQEGMSALLEKRRAKWLK